MIGTVSRFWRKLMHNKMYTGLNMIGFVAGLSICFVILLYVLYETGYDQFHEEKNRIYRIIQMDDLSGKQSARTPVALADALKKQVPEVETAFRMEKSNVSIFYKGKSIRERNFWYADADLFDVLSIEVISGDFRVLDENKSMIFLSESMNDKYFGKKSIKEPLKVKKRGGDLEFYVAGVFKDLPKQSSIKVDFIASGLSAFDGIAPPDDWYDYKLNTFVLLKKNASFVEFKNKALELVLTHQQKERTKSCLVQPLSAMYLNSRGIGQNNFETGNKENLYIFSFVALLVLFMAIFNHVVLAITRVFTQTKEIGLRKMMGASTIRLVSYIPGESLLLIVFVLPIAFIVAELLFPVMNNFLGVNLSLFKDGNWGFFTGITMLALFAGMVPGIIIALYMTRIQPNQIFHSTFSKISTRTGFWKGFVVAQLFVFMVMTASSFVIYKQLVYTQTKNMGFDQNNLLLIENMPSAEDIAAMGYSKAAKNAHQRALLFKNEILNMPGVNSATLMEDMPPVRISGNFNMAVQDQPDQQFIANGMFADEDFIRTLGLELIQGRGFRVDDSQNSAIINETAFKQIGVDNILDYKFENIIGVVNDFNLHTLKDEIAPLCVWFDNSSNYQLIVNIDSGAQSDILKSMNAKWDEMFADKEFRYSFFEDHVGLFYKDELNFNKMVRMFTFISLLITILGLFGLTFFIVERRTKEIGIRKVLGATLVDISLYLVREFHVVVGIAIALSIPIVVLVMNKWLENFAYHIQIGVLVFVMSIALSLFFVMLPIMYNVLKAARENPVEALRYE